jgi:hypothetical protein
MNFRGTLGGRVDFFEKMQCRSSGMSRDEVTALEMAWEQVPVPVQIVVKRDGTVYFDGQMSTTPVEYDDELATFDGQPCVIIEPLPDGYRWHPVYNPDGVDAAREACFQNALDDIKKQKWIDVAQTMQAIEERGRMKFVCDEADRLLQNASAALLFHVLKDEGIEAARLELPEVRVDCANLMALDKFRRRFAECFKGDAPQTENESSESVADFSQD